MTSIQQLKSLPLKKSPSSRLKTVRAIKDIGFKKEVEKADEKLGKGHFLTRIFDKG